MYNFWIFTFSTHSKLQSQNFLMSCVHGVQAQNGFFPHDKCKRVQANSLVIAYEQLLFIVQRPLCISCVKTYLLHLLLCYNTLHALASLMISLHRPLPQALFHHVFTSKVLRYFNTESSHFNLGLPFFLLPSWL